MLSSQKCNVTYHGFAHLSIMTEDIKINDLNLALNLQLTL